MTRESGVTIDSVIRVHGIVRDRVARSWATYAKEAPDAPWPKAASVRVSTLLLRETLSLVSSSFGLAAAQGRMEGDWRAARTALAEARAALARADAYSRAGVWDVESDRLVRLPSCVALAAPGLVLDVLLEASEPSRLHGWSTSEVVAQLRDAKSEGPLNPQLFHALRSIVLRDTALAALVVEEASPTRLKIHPNERRVWAWVESVTRTASCLLTPGFLLLPVSVV